MDEIAQHFSIMLKNNTGLEELHMQKYEMRDYGAQWLSEHLAYNHALVYLDLSWYIIFIFRNLKIISL
jgi:hypothetical protein